MMKRVIVLSIAAMFVIGAAAVAAPVSHAVAPGFNLLAPPVVPFDPAPDQVFMTDTGAPIPLQGYLYRYDAATQGYMFYDPDFPEDYGNVLLGDGLFLRSDSGATWQYDGAPDGLATDDPPTYGTMTDMWISCPAAGFTMFGHPFNHSVPIANCALTDGFETKTWDEASQAGWCLPALYGFEGGYFTVGSDDIDFDRTEVEAWHGYYIRTYQPNLALLIPADPAVSLP